MMSKERDELRKCISLDADVIKRYVEKLTHKKVDKLIAMRIYYDDDINDIYDFDVIIDGQRTIIKCNLVDDE